MEERFVKLKELLTDEEQAKRLLNLSAEEAAKVLEEEYGIHFTVDELNDIMLGIQDSVKERENGELSANDLDQVAGGGRGSDSYNFGRSVGGAVPAMVVLVCVAIKFGW